MKKVIVQCTGNIMLFTLLGLAFIHPFSEINQHEAGFSGTLSVFPFLLVAYLVIYPVIYYVLARKYKWKKTDNTELAYLDEREKHIVAESTKTAYKTLIGGVMVVVAIIGGVKFFSLFTHFEISIYIVSIISLTALLNISNILYCVRWCLEYKR